MQSARTEFQLRYMPLMAAEMGLFFCWNTHPVKLIESRSRIEGYRLSTSCLETPLILFNTDLSVSWLVNQLTLSWILRGRLVNISFSLLISSSHLTTAETSKLRVHRLRKCVWTDVGLSKYSKYRFFCSPERLKYAKLNMFPWLN